MSTWSYDATSTTDLNKVRRRIGDIDTKRQLIQDEEVADYLAEYSNDIYLTCVACVEFILAKIARDVDRNNVGMSSTRSQMTTHYQDLLTKLKRKAYSGAESYVGGVSKSERDALESDTDYNRNEFVVGMDDHPEAGGDK